MTLPVIQTCGECRLCDVGPTAPSGPGEPRRRLPDYCGAEPRSRRTDAKAAPPSWCPLPKAADDLGDLRARIETARRLWADFKAIPVKHYAERGSAYAAFIKAVEHAELEVGAVCRGGER